MPSARKIQFRIFASRQRASSYYYNIMVGILIYIYINIKNDYYNINEIPVGLSQFSRVHYGSIRFFFPQSLLAFSILPDTKFFLHTFIKKKNVRIIIKKKKTVFLLLTQEKFGSQPVHAQRHPQRRGYASDADPQGVRVHGLADLRPAQVGRVQRAVLFDVHGRHLAHGHVRARLLFFELFEPVEQLREPHHQRVITAHNNAQMFIINTHLCDITILIHAIAIFLGACSFFF